MTTQKKAVLSTYFPDLVDVVKTPTGLQFLKKDASGLSIVPKHTAPDGVYIPPEIRAVPFDKTISEGQAVIDRFNQKEPPVKLYRDLIRYFKELIELPSPAYYALFAVWVFHTYIVEQFQHTPFLFFYAVPGRGKTRAGECLIYTAFRGVCATSPTAANLFRFADPDHATLFIDATDLSDSAKKGGYEDLLLNRYEKGGRVARVTAADRPTYRDRSFFDVYGPTVLASNTPIDDALESRCIPVTMPLTAKIFTKSPDTTTTAPLRERLLAFRAQWMNSKLPQIKKPHPGRLGDSFLPLLQTAQIVNPRVTRLLRGLIPQIEEAQQIERGDSLEAQVIEAIINLEHQVVAGYLASEHVRATVNKDRPERLQYSSRRIGSTVRALGYKRGTVSNGRSGILWDEQFNQKLAGRYGVSINPSEPEASETSTPPDAENDIFS